MKRCDLIVISYGPLNYTKGCIESIERNTGYPHRVIIVDNASGEETLAYLKSLAGQGRIVLIESAVNEGWVKAVNRGIAASDAEYLCVMNNDIVVYPGWLGEMVKAAESDPSVGLVNPEWQLPKHYPRGRDFYFRNRIRRNQGRVIETDWARGFCFLITRPLVTRIGGLDLEFSPGYYDDWDYSVRAVKSGYITVRALGAFVWHYKNVSFDQVAGSHSQQISLVEQKGRLFYQRWGVPLRLLLAGELPWEGDKLKELLLELLRDQHRVSLISPARPAAINHTNFRQRSLPGPLAMAAGILVLLDDARHSAAKRFDLIVCGQKTREVFDRFPAIREKYSYFIPAGGNSARDLVKTATRLKYEKKF